MSNPVYIVGLDIGTTKIACFVGEKVENGKIVIRGYGKTESTGVKRGMVFNIEETVNAIRRAVDMASEQSNVDIKTVNVGIAGHHIRRNRQTASGCLQTRHDTGRGDHRRHPAGIYR